MKSFRLLLAALVAGAMSACTLNLGGLAGQLGVGGTSQDKGSSDGKTDGKTDGNAGATGGTTNPGKEPVFGRVLSQSGQPVPGVAITAFLNNTSPLVGNAGAGLIGNAGSGFNSANPLANNSGGAYRIAGTYRLQAVGSATTDSEGKFALTPSSTGDINLEAVESADSKAWKAEVTYSGGGQPLDAGTMQLAPTGKISGKVTAPNAPTVKNFEGVEIFIPGSSYIAKADQGGNYLMTNVPAGSFLLVAFKTGLGGARRPGVAVESNLVTQAADLALTLSAPKITKIDPPNAGPGAEVMIRGEHFGASSGDTLQVAFSGANATGVTRLDDGTIKAVIPPAAVTGELSVTVNGIVSNGHGFKVVKDIGLNLGDVELLLGRSQEVSAAVNDTRSEAIAGAVVHWASSAGAVTVTPSGTMALIKATGVGDAQVSVESGQIRDEMRVHVFRIDGVSVASTSVLLNAQPTDGSMPEAEFRTTAQIGADVAATDRQDRRVTWSSRNTAIASVDSATGMIIAARTDTGGSTEVIATSDDDPRHTATISVTVTTLGNLFVGVK